MRLFASIASVFILIALLTSWDNYKIGSLSNLSMNERPFAQETAGIEIVSKQYTGEESKAYLYKDVTRRGYEAIQITIKNNTPDTYIIPDFMTSLPSATPDEVVWKFTQLTIPRGIALRIASFFFWPAMIPSTIDSIVVYKSHKKLKKDYLAKGIKKEEVAPYSTMNRVIFVKSSKYFAPFTVTLVEKNSRELKNFSCTPGENIG